MKERNIDLGLGGVEAKIVYQDYDGFEIKSLLVSLGDKRRLISTKEGYRESRFVVNHYNPHALWESIHARYEEFERWIPSALGVPPQETAVLTTAADMDNLALGEKGYEEFMVCCLATAGVKSNAQRPAHGCG